MATDAKPKNKPNKRFVFDDILAAGLKAGHGRIERLDAINWYRSKVSRSPDISKGEILAEARSAKRSKITPIIGRMYFMGYDPKTQDTLPFYDTFPLVIICDLQNDGFTAINLHYCPLPLRAKLMAALFKLVDNKALTPRTKLNISYQTLQAAKRLDAFKPCFKKYLFNHVRTNFVEVYPAEWSTAIWLPVANWQKASERQVHKWALGQIK